MADLPFEVTPIIQRYLKDLGWWVDEYFAGEKNDDLYFVENYAGEESNTPRSEKNRKAFWAYFEKTKVVWLGAEVDAYQNGSKCQEIRILKAQPIKDLIGLIKNDKGKKARVHFDTTTKVLTFENKYIKFHKNSTKVKVFSVLFSRYQNQQGYLDGPALAELSSLIADRKLYSSVKEQLSQQITDINTKLKGMPIKVQRQNGAYELVDRKVKTL